MSCVHPSVETTWCIKVYQGLVQIHSLSVVHSAEMNSSIDPSETDVASDTHKAVATCLVAVALFMNTICVVLTGRIAYWKPQWPNILVVHVGVTDVCLLLLVLVPGTLALYVPSIPDSVHFCQYQGTVLNMWYILNFMLLVLIMFDRYFAITHPFVYSKRILNNKAHVWSTLTYIGITVFSSLIACLPLAMNVEFVVLGPGLCFWNISQEHALPVAIINVAFIVIVIALLIFFAMGIIIGVFSILRRTHSHEEDKSNNVNKTEVNFTKLSIVTSLVFGTSSIPFTVSQCCNSMLINVTYNACNP